MLIMDPVHVANPPLTIKATACFSTAQSAPSGQFTLMLQAPLFPKGVRSVLSLVRLLGEGNDILEQLDQLQFHLG